jgi:serine/threonine protein phosphatase PrpC
MEDTFCHMDSVAGDQSCGLFGIFDGHGGKQVSEHCCEMMPLELKKELAKKPQDLYKSLEMVFEKIDG